MGNKNPIRYIIAAISFLLFLAIPILLFTGKTDILTAFVSKYMDLLKNGPLWMVIIIFILASAGSSAIFTFGICYNIIQKDKNKTKPLFVVFFIIFFVIQLISRIL